MHEVFACFPCVKTPCVPLWQFTTYCSRGNKKILEDEYKKTICRLLPYRISSHLVSCQVVRPGRLLTPEGVFSCVIVGNKAIWATNKVVGPAKTSEPIRNFSATMTSAAANHIIHEYTFSTSCQEDIPTVRHTGGEGGRRKKFSERLNESWKEGISFHTQERYLLGNPPWYPYVLKWNPRVYGAFIQKYWK